MLLPWGDLCRNLTSASTLSSDERARETGVCESFLNKARERIAEKRQCEQAGETECGSQPAAFLHFTSPHPVTRGVLLLRRGRHPLENWRRLVRGYHDERNTNIVCELLATR